ncbi:MAG: hypothetical protein QOJ26_1512, partial [Thermoplasmata archaeon]|nr:hypothetical protein [Thermoplasmata archaeon]
MSAARRVLPSLILAFLLAASILAVQPVDSFPTTAGQRAEVRDAIGEDTPFPTFEVRSTQNRFWINGGPTEATGFFTDASAIDTP